MRIWDAQSGATLATYWATAEGWVAFTPDGRRYQLGGNLAGSFWYTIGLCRFEPGELDPFVPAIRRLAPNEPLLPA